MNKKASECVSESEKMFKQHEKKELLFNEGQSYKKRVNLQSKGKRGCERNGKLGNLDGTVEKKPKNVYTL